MENNNHVKYKEDQYLFNEEKKESISLNNSKEDINIKNISENFDKSENNILNNKETIKKENESDYNMNNSESQLFDNIAGDNKNKSNEKNNKQQTFNEMMDISKDKNIININEDVINKTEDYKQENNNEIEIEKQSKGISNKKENRDNINKYLYIMKKNDKNSSKSSDSQLMSETQLLKMSLNENDNKNNIKINEKNNKKENDNKEKDIKIEEENNNIKNEINNISEVLTDNIIQNELNEISKEKEGNKNEQKEKQKKYITIKDLENEPFKEMKIDSPRSLKVINENGFTFEELYYNPKKGVDDSYEKIRLNKIKKLCELRDKLIQNKNEKSINNENDELIKYYILNRQEKILDNNLERIKAKNDIELANIVEYELDKNLFKLELKKSEKIFKKEKLKLKPYEIILKEKNKKYKNKRYKTLENKKPTITNLKSPKENLLTFYIGKRKNEYSFSKKRLSQKLEKIELINLKKNEQFKLKKSIEKERAKINLRRSEEKFNNKIENLKKKMEWKDLMTNVIKRIVKGDKSEKKELNKKKYLIKKDYINKMKKKEEIEREIKLEILNKKMEKRKAIKDMTKRIYSSRIDKYNKMEKERINNISKIQKILKKGEGENEKNLDILLEEFPDNSRIVGVIKDYQIKKNEIKNNKNLRFYSSNGNLYNNLINNSYNRTIISNNINKSSDNKRIFIYSNNKKEMKKIKEKNEKIKIEERRINNINESKKLKKEDEDVNEINYEHELKEKIRLFKIQIYKNFLKKIKDEKMNEIMRKKQLKIIKDETLRKNLETQFSLERALIDMRLRKESENLQKISKEYENKLKSNLLKKQDRILNLVKEINEKKEN